MFVTSEHIECLLRLQVHVSFTEAASIPTDEDDDHPRDRSTAQEQTEIRDIVKYALSDKGKALQIVKLLLVLSIPLIALIALSTITLAKIFSGSNIRVHVNPDL